MRSATFAFALWPHTYLRCIDARGLPSSTYPDFAAVGLAADDDAVPQPPPADASILEAFNQATSPSFAERLFPYTMDNGIPQVLVHNTAQ